MKIALASDHAGFELKEAMKTMLVKHIEVLDFGTTSESSMDYPDTGFPAAQAVSEGMCDFGILICGTGIGMSMVANKFPNVRASLCNDLFTAKMSRSHNDANVLVLGGRIIGKDLAMEIVKVWLTTPFEGARHLNRIRKIKAIEERLNLYGTQ